MSKPEIPLKNEKSRTLNVIYPSVRTKISTILPSLNIISLGVRSTLHCSETKVETFLAAEFLVQEVLSVHSLQHFLSAFWCTNIL